MIDVPPESQVIGRSCARRPTRARSLSIPSSASTTSRSRSHNWPRRAAISRGCSMRSSANGICRLSIDQHVLRNLQRDLRVEPAWRVTVAVHDGSVVTAIWPDFHAPPTASHSTSGRRPSRGTSATSPGEVVASAGDMNPQIRFGEDLMSRVSYVMLNPGAEKAHTSRARVPGEADELVRHPRAVARVRRVGLAAQRHQLGCARQPVRRRRTGGARLHGSRASRSRRADSHERAGAGSEAWTVHQRRSVRAGAVSLAVAQSLFVCLEQPADARRSERVYYRENRRLSMEEVDHWMRSYDAAMQQSLAGGPQHLRLQAVDLGVAGLLRRRPCWARRQAPFPATICWRADSAR